MIFCHWKFIILYAALLFSSNRASVFNSEDKLIAINTGRENHFNCENEVQIYESDCSYEVKGLKIEISAGKRCKLRFGCNSTIFMAICCFEDRLEARQISQTAIQLLSADKYNITKYSNNETDNQKSTLFNLKIEDNFLRIKIDGTFKLLLVLLILLLMVMLTSIVFCKVWCLKKMIAAEPTTYTVFKDNQHQDKKIPANGDGLQRNENLINLNQDVPAITDIGEIDISDMPLKV